MNATATATWHGRRGAVILGPTETRVARYLDDATKRGRVTIRTVELAARLQLERSEAYRITRRLRILGLFGIENDKGGTRGGRRYWRTAISRDGAALDDRRQRAAWGRIVAWARSRRYRLRALLLRHGDGRLPAGAMSTASGGGMVPVLAARSVKPGQLELSRPFRDRLRDAAEAQGLGDLVTLLDEWSGTSNPAGDDGARPAIAPNGSDHLDGSADHAGNT